MRRSLRELELEQEIQQLKVELMEVTARAGLMPSTYTHIGQQKKEIMAELPPRLILSPTAGMSLKRDKFAGWRKDVWGYGDDRLEFVSYTELGRFDKDDLPYILDMQHEQFQYAILDFINKRKLAP